MSNTDKRYSFLSYLKQGLGNQLSTSDDAGDTSITLKRPEVNVTLDMQGVADVSKQVSLFGPGDIERIDTNAIIRHAPITNESAFLPNFMAFIDFYEEDFPWRYTPVTPSTTNNILSINADSNGDNGIDVTQVNNLRPWLFLLVLEKPTQTQTGEYEDTFVSTTKNRVIKITGDPNKVFPIQSQIWAWAHVQTLVDATQKLGDSNKSSGDTDFDEARSELKELLETTPQRGVSRIICPRKLQPETEYEAFLVPSFELGRVAGLGQDVSSSSASIQTPSWDSAAASSENKDFPVYYSWGFKTDTSGDFESLVRKVQPAFPDPLVGSIPLNISKPGHPTLDGVSTDGYWKIGGALKQEGVAHLDFLNSGNSNFVDSLESLVNIQADLEQTPPTGVVDPIISLPMYGRWHTGEPTVDQDGQWLSELNLNPEYRAAAGIGAELVRKNQSSFMQQAWEQVGDIRNANTGLAFTQTAYAVAELAKRKNISTLPDQQVLQATRDSHMLLKDKTNGNTVKTSLKQSRVPDAMFDIAFVGLTRAQSGLMKKSGISFSNKTTLVNAVATGTIMPVPTRVFPTKRNSIENALGTSSTINGERFTSTDVYTDFYLLDPDAQNQVVTWTTSSSGTESEHSSFLKNTMAPVLDDMDSESSLYPSTPTPLEVTSSGIASEVRASLEMQNIFSAKIETLFKRNEKPLSISSKAVIKTTKNATSWDSGFASEEMLYGDGYIEWKVQDPIASNHRVMVALSYANNGTNPPSTNYAFYTFTDNNTRIFINGTNIGSGGLTSYSPGDILKIERVNHKVKFYKNNGLIYEVSENNASKGQPLLLDAHFLDPNTKAGNFRLVEYQKRRKKLPLSYTDKVGITIKGDRIDGTGANGTWDNSGFASQNSLSNHGYVQWVVSSPIESNHTVQVGFSYTNPDAHYNSIKAALRTKGNDEVTVCLNGVDQSVSEPYQVGDVLKIERLDGGFNFYKNDELLFETTEASGFDQLPVIVDAAFRNAGTVLNGLELYEYQEEIIDTYQASPVDVVGIDIQNGVATKTEVTDWGNAGYASLRSIGSNGSVEWTVKNPPEDSRYIMAGLSYENVDEHFGNIDFALYTHDGTALRVFRNGVNQNVGFAYEAGSKIKLERKGGKFNTYVDGELVYSVSEDPGSVNTPMILDVAMHSEGTIMDLPTMTNVVAVPRDFEQEIPIHIVDREALRVDYTRYDRIMEAPEIDAPVFDLLRDYSRDFIIPNFDKVSENTTTILEPNKKFIEAMLVGMNYEFGRELLWNNYPTDQRGTYFRNFWPARNVSKIKSYEHGPNVTDDVERVRDIMPIHQWPLNTTLGTHGPAHESGGANLILVIKAELLKKFPNLYVYAIPAKWEETSAGSGVFKRVPDDDPQTIKEYPVLSGAMPPNCTLVGFNLNKTKALGSTDMADNDPGYFVVIEERVGDVRFGLDEDGFNYSNLNQQWGSLAWGHMGADNPSTQQNDPTQLNFIDIRELNIESTLLTTLQNTNSIGHWAESSGDMASIVIQPGVSFAIHFDDLVQ